MNNVIWIGNNDGIYYYSTSKIVIRSGGFYSTSNIQHLSLKIITFLNIDLENFEIAQLIHDTEMQTFTIKRERKIGWYLAQKKPVVSISETVSAYHWNGENFAARRTNDSPFEFITYHESELEIDERPLSSHLFKGLE